MNPLVSRLVTSVAIAAVAFAGGAYLGYHYASNASKAGTADAQTVAIENHDAAAVVGQAVERETVQRAVKTEAVFNGIQLGMISYAQNHPFNDVCRLDDDGLRLWNAANAGADATSSAERDAGMPGIASSSERSHDGSSDQSRRRGDGLSPVQGSAPGAGAVAGENAQ